MPGLVNEELTVLAQSEANRLRKRFGWRNWGTAMSKISSAIVAVALCASFLPTTAKTENGQIAAGVAGGLLGGMLLGGALARPAPPPPIYYAPPPPARVYVEEPVCRMVRERFWDGYGWQYRHVEVCN